jgi:hypothetical protein
MSQNDSDEVLEWSVLPFKENIRRSVLVLVVIAAIGVLVYFWFGSAYLGVLSVALLLMSLHTFFTRTTYRLDSEGLKIKTNVVKTAKQWSEFKRYYPDRRGITLSPFARPSRLEPFRSTRLLYGGNKDEVVAFISKKLDRDPGDDPGSG